MGESHTLRQRRRALDLSQAELARRAGCHLNTVHRIERGHVVPDLRLAKRLAEALETTPVDLFPEFLSSSPAA